MVRESADKCETVGSDESMATSPTSFGPRPAGPSPRAAGAKSRAAALRNTLKIVGLVTLVMVVAISVYLVLRFTIKNDTGDDVEDYSEVVAVEEKKPEEPVVVLLERVDFQTVVDEWVESVGGNKSVLIYDLERDEVVGEYNSSESYSTASLYKLFVVYEGYRRVQSGEWGGADAAGATGHTILECLDLAIRESDSECAETLWGYIGRDELDKIVVREFGVQNTDVSHLISTPSDIMKIMKMFYEHPDIRDTELVAAMKDSFLNQPTTIYNWRQGLPSGFERANVYNKVGWEFNPDGNYWNIYHDAAIVEFPETNRHFIVVVMTNRVPFQRIRELGGRIETAI